MKRNKNVEWIFAKNGSVLVRNRKNFSTFSLRDNYLLIWVTLTERCDVTRLMKLTGLRKEKILSIVGVLKNQKLIQ
jgi:hypothetical protein